MPLSPADAAFAADPLSKIAGGRGRGVLPVHREPTNPAAALQSSSGIRGENTRRFIHYLGGGRDLAALNVTLQLR